MIYDQRAEGREVRHAGMLRKNVIGGGKSKCEGLEGRSFPGMLEEHKNRINEMLLQYFAK